MRRYLIEKIERCRTDLLHALDCNDYMSAIKLRAVQKGFEELLQVMDEERTGTQDVIHDMQYNYTSKEAAALLGVHPSNITRRAAALRGQKVKGRWYFPRQVIDEEVKSADNRSKPGRKQKQR